MTRPLPIVGLIHVMILSVVLSSPTTAIAQEVTDTGGRVFGLIGGSFGNGGSAVLTSGGAGVRITRTLGLDFEVFHVSGLDLPDDDFFIQPLIFAPRFGFERDGAVTGFLSKVVVDFPIGDRVIPFVSGGGGVGRISEELSFSFGDRIGNDGHGIPELLRNFGRDQRLSIFPRDFDRAELGLALTVGGGVDIRLWKGLTVGAEARWLRVLADTRTLDLAHIGSRVAYRF